jgi:hypothetical protein
MSYYSPRRRSRLTRSTFSPRRHSSYYDGVDTRQDSYEALRNAIRNNDATLVDQILKTTHFNTIQLQNASMNQIIASIDIKYAPESEHYLLLMKNKAIENLIRLAYQSALAAESN